MDLNFLFSEKASDTERKDFLLALNARGITATDLVEFVHFLLPRDFPELPAALDICGTGGSGLARFNVSTVNAFLLAAAGLPIAKHGNRAAGGRCGSFDLLESLGVPFDFSAEQLKKIFARENLIFIFARNFFPAMRFFAKVRTELKVPTIFNLLGPLLNPARVQYQIVGTNSRKNAKLLTQAARDLGRKKFAAVTAENGLDEITLTGKTFVSEFNGKEVKETELSAADFSLPEYSFAEIAGGDLAFNTQLAREILQNQRQDAHTDLVLANAAFALKFWGKVPDLQEGVSQAREILAKGLAKQKLEASCQASSN